MRSSAVGTRCLLLLLVISLSAAHAQKQPQASAELIDARRLFRQGEFRESAAAFQKLADREPSPDAYAGLVQSFLKLDDVKTAEDRSLRALKSFPDAAAAHAARGDVLFRRGLISDADDEYKAAMKLDPDCSRAWLGTGKIEESRSHRKTAQANVAKAHELNPDDGNALYEWAVRQPYPGNVSGLEKHLAEFRSDPEVERHEREYLELLKALAGRKVWILSSDVDHAELKLESLMLGSGMERRGYGVRVSFNDKGSALLLLDTGASGVTITRKFAEKIGARKLSDQVLQGIGKGGLPGYQAWVDKVAVGNVQFHDCFVHVVPHMVVDVDGLIGTDVFVKFLVAIDFPAGKLALSPLPSGADAERGSAPFETFSPAYSFGHILLLPAKASDKTSGLFVLDSGANISTISNQLGLSLSHTRPLNVRASGVGGGTTSSFIADEVNVQFAGARRRDQHMIAVDLRSLSKNLGAEVAGQIGFATLETLRLIIDYRDGLVRVEEKK